MNRRIAALALIGVPILFNVTYFALAARFDYPGILREPTDVILTRFAAGGGGLVALWYAFAFSALLAVPLALVLLPVFHAEHGDLSIAAAIVGALAGLVQVLGLLRWVFLVPGLAATYTNGAADPALRAAATVMFEAGHRYLGMAVGEHLGYLFTAAWSVLLAVMILRSRQWPAWLAWPGIVAAVGIVAGVLEPAGWEAAGLINALAYIIWSLWLVTMGVVLLRRRAVAGVLVGA